MKKYIAFILAAAIFLMLPTSCGTGTAEKQASGKPLRVVVTVFPIYDWVREILGDELVNTELTMLQDNSIDLHNYQPSAEDMLKIATCDLFIYIGGESDDWVESSLAGAGNQGVRTINLIEALGDLAVEEKLSEGMEPEDEDDSDEGTELDEHIWLSLKNAQVLVSVISEVLAEIHQESADVYRVNAGSYREKLADLDMKYQAAVDAGSCRTILFGDRFPFRYLAEDYDLTYYAAFSGCSAETEASFDTIIFLAEKVDELGLHTVLTIEGSDGKIAQTIISNTAGKGIRIMTLDSMQAINSKDVEDGVTYLTIMEKNLDVLASALY